MRTHIFNTLKWTLLALAVVAETGLLVAAGLSEDLSKTPAPVTCTNCVP